MPDLDRSTSSNSTAILLPLLILGPPIDGVLALITATVIMGWESAFFFIRLMSSEMPGVEMLAPEDTHRLPTIMIVMLVSSYLIGFLPALVSALVVRARLTKPGGTNPVSIFITGMAGALVIAGPLLAFAILGSVVNLLPAISVSISLALICGAISVFVCALVHRFGWV